MSTGSLSKALSQAQERARPVEHDAENTFHHYRYTSAEAVIAEAKQALAGCGLAVLPLAHELVLEDGRFALRRQLALLHEGGEERPLTVVWPVVPDRGRPLDKAVAAALTTSLAYALRDLLLMPRVDPDDDLAGRDDREPEEEPRRASGPPPGPARPGAGGPPPLGRRLADHDARLARAGVIAPGALLAYLADALPEDGLPRDLDRVPPAAIGRVAALVKRFEEEARSAAARDQELAI